MRYILGCLLACLLFASTACADGGADLFNKTCKSCHGADGGKVAMGMTRPVKDLNQEEVKAALTGYRAGTYGGEKKSMMERVAKSLSDADIDALSTYVSGL